MRMTHCSVDAALEAMRGRRALLIGDLMLDAYLYGQTQRISREAPVLVVRQERIEHRLGGAANTAANLQALGLETLVVGTVGDDAAGNTLRSMLRKRGADLQGLVTVSHPTPVKTRILAGAFGTSPQQVLRLDQQTELPLSQTELRALHTNIQKIADLADVIVVSDYGGGVLHPSLVQAVQALAKRGKTVCVDSRYQLHAFCGVTAVTPNLPEAEEAVGFSLQTHDAVHSAGGLLLEKLQCEAVLVTQGQMGMTLFESTQKPIHTDVVGATEATDVTGAGDSVIATLSGALAADLGWRNAMLLANCAAGVVVTKMGTVSPLPHEIAAAAHGAQVELEPWAK